ncbi:hypothetical protein ACM66B_005397 [Microbotryomycetes sp. NB124-2]
MWPFSSSAEPAPQASAPPSACPVDHTTRKQWLASNNSSPSSSSPHQAQPRPRLAQQPQLSTDREVSSIPRWLPKDSSAVVEQEPRPNEATSSAETACPARSAPVTSSDSTQNQSSDLKKQDSQQENWVYPSPASFYAALQRKNRNPRAQDMNIVVPIHNAVNERVWHQILDWERQALWSQGQDPDKVETKLVSFIGKPKQLSPRARWKTLIGYTAPFDRHDWIVDRPSYTPGSDQPQSSQRIRYVIDFYTGRGAGLLDQPAASNETADNLKPNLAFYIDCRPALDDWEGVSMRWTRWWNSWSTLSPRPASTSAQQQQQQ